MRSETRRDIALDFLADVAIELKTQATRTILLTSAVALSIGALLASMGITNNAAHAIDADLAASTGRQVVVRLAEDTAPGESGAPSNTRKSGGETIQREYPSDTVERLQALSAVQHVGVMLPVSQVHGVTVARPATKTTRDNQSVRAVTSDYFAAGAARATGAVSLMDSELPVAILGEAAAKTFGVPFTADLTGVSMLIDGRQFAVVGFVKGDGMWANDVFIPYTVGRGIAGNDRQAEVLLHSKVGAGSQVAKVARLALRPEAPQTLAASQVISAGASRGKVANVLGQQAAWIGGFLLILTMLLITNSMVVSVTSRTTEIGIRRALGASRSAIAITFLVEGALVGFLGGLAGSVLSALVVLAVSAFSGWSAFLSAVWLAGGPLLGTAVGVLASVYPAVRAARVQPAIAVRSN